LFTPKDETEMNNQNSDTNRRPQIKRERPNSARQALDEITRFKIPNFANVSFSDRDQPLVVSPASGLGLSSVSENRPNVFGNSSNTTHTAGNPNQGVGQNQMPQLIQVFNVTPSTNELVMNTDQSMSNRRRRVKTEESDSEYEEGHNPSNKPTRFERNESGFKAATTRPNNNPVPQQQVTQKTPRLTASQVSSPRNIQQPKGPNTATQILNTLSSARSRTEEDEVDDVEEEDGDEADAIEMRTEQPSNDNASSVKKAKVVGSDPVSLQVLLHDPCSNEDYYDSSCDELEKREIYEDLVSRVKREREYRRARMDEIKRRREEIERRRSERLKRRVKISVSSQLKRNVVKKLLTKSPSEINPDELINVAKMIGQEEDQLEYLDRQEKEEDFAYQDQLESFDDLFEDDLEMEQTISDRFEDIIKDMDRNDSTPVPVLMERDPRKMGRTPASRSNIIQYLNNLIHDNPLEKKKRFLPKSSCFGCSRRNNFHDSINKTKMAMLTDLIESGYGTMENEELARVAHQFFMKQIYIPMRNRGQRIKLWRTWHIQCHIENHSMCPKIYIGEQIRKEKRWIKALENVAGRLRYFSDGRIDCTLDDAIMREIDRAKKRLNILYKSNPRKMNFFNPDSRTDLGRAGIILNSYIENEGDSFSKTR
jgi:hypothetical protein